MSASVAPVYTPLLRPLAWVYAAVMNARNRAFDLGLRDVIETGVPVLSIGNLTAGGTGKTPLTAKLVEGFAARGIRVGLVSRGYGGSERGPARVPSSVPAGGIDDRAKRFGDEPTWFASRFPEVPVFVGRDRVSAVTAMRRSNPTGQAIDLIIADDAFPAPTLEPRA